MHHHLAIELREAFVDVVSRNMQGGLCDFMRQFLTLAFFHRGASGATGWFSRFIVPVLALAS
jgi:hypothetical protein